MVVMAIPRDIQKATTPRDITEPRTKQRDRIEEARDKLMILIGISGRTHGVKFSNSPPTTAMNSNSQILEPANAKSHPKKETVTLSWRSFMAWKSYSCNG